MLHTLSNSPYSIGIPEMDEQHQRLINIASDLYEALNKNEGSEMLVTILDKLIDYTIIHFGDEEKLMSDLKYPGLDEHKKEHEELTARVVAFREKVGRDKSKDFQKVTDIMSFLQDWLIDHIAVSDMKYSEFMGRTHSS